jgi:hypothetical protein
MRLRCPECRTRRTDPALMALHRLHCIRPLCHCEGVPFAGGLAAHRPGTLGCDLHPLAPLTRAERRGESPEMLAYIAARMPGPDVPF